MRVWGSVLLFMSRCTGATKYCCEQKGTERGKGAVHLLKIPRVKSHRVWDVCSVIGWLTMALSVDISGYQEVSLVSRACLTTMPLRPLRLVST